MRKPAVAPVPRKLTFVACGIKEFRGHHTELGAWPQSQLPSRSEIWQRGSLRRLGPQLMRFSQVLRRSEHSRVRRPHQYPAWAIVAALQPTPTRNSRNSELM